LGLIWADIPQISDDVEAMIARSAGFGNDKSRIAWVGAGRTSQMTALRWSNALLCPD
jgi:hypothetical protein